MHAIRQTGVILGFIERQRQLRRIRRNIRDTTNPFEIPEARFIQLYRLPNSVALQLVEDLRPHIRIDDKPDAIPIHITVLIALHYYASGSFEAAKDQDFLDALRHSRISNAILVVSRAINQHLAKKYIKFPEHWLEIVKAKEGFKKKLSNLPDIIGCVDCTHIPVKIIRHNVEIENSSKNVQIICDANKKILNIDAKFEEGTPKSSIWASCQVKTILKNKFDTGEDRSSYLLGDTDYDLEPWLMIPYIHLDEPYLSHKKAFNKCIAIQRVVVERSINLLKCRFRCLSSKKPLRYDGINAEAVINSCAALHNLIIDLKLPITHSEETFMESERGAQIELQKSVSWNNKQHEIDDFDNREGEILRSKLTQQMFNQIRN